MTFLKSSSNPLRNPPFFSPQRTIFPQKALFLIFQRQNREQEICPYLLIPQMCYSNNGPISFAYFSSCRTPPRKYTILESWNIHFDKMSFAGFRQRSTCIRVINLPFVLHLMATCSLSFVAKPVLQHIQYNFLLFIFRF